MPKNTFNSEWNRNCPQCNKIIYYSSKQNLCRAEKNISVCRSCKMTGRFHSKETKEKISTSQIGRVPWNKNKHGIYSSDTLRKISLSSRGRISFRRGKSLSNETKKKISKSLFGKKQSLETRHRRRISMIETLNKKYLKVFPNYNKNACILFEEINKELNWHGQHAENGGEFHIKELGYWVDYYEPIINVVIEFDENRHNSLSKKTKDIQRQKEIEEFLKCKFYRIAESEFKNWRNIIL